MEEDFNELTVTLHDDSTTEIRSEDTLDVYNVSKHISINIYNELKDRNLPF